MISKIISRKKLKFSVFVNLKNYNMRKGFTRGV